jgi:hypothetical protein
LRDIKATRAPPTPHASAVIASCIHRARKCRVCMPRFSAKGLALIHRSTCTKTDEFQRDIVAVKSITGLGEFPTIGQRGRAMAYFQPESVVYLSSRDSTTDLEVPGKTTKPLSQNSRSFDRDSNWASPEHESRWFPNFSGPLPPALPYKKHSSEQRFAQPTQEDNNKTRYRI